MIIKFLGTAAAEGIPALFCRCNTCLEARKTGGKELRTRSQTIVDGKLMIDFPAETYAHSLQHNIQLSQVKHYLITHSHDDHFYPQDIAMLAKMFSGISENTEKFYFYGSDDVALLAKPFIEKTFGTADFITLEPFKTYTIASYSVTPLKATHNTKTPFIYIISDGTKQMLYAHDTGLFCKETEDYLYNEKPYFDLISFDCCCGTWPDVNHGTHLSLGNIKTICEKMQKYGIIDKHTKLCCNHFSHNASNVLYNNHKIYEDEGFIMTYDGLEIEF
ncbi:MAG: hypothetical protein E7545_00180 [Ruminococcaceae bacterium]|nr:hypothetical protein [Oscillospiraceae bacterium]